MHETFGFSKSCLKLTFLEDNVYLNVQIYKMFKKTWI